MVKIDTKEAFSIFCLSEDEITENMSEELKKTLLQKRDEKPGNVIIQLPETNQLSALFIKDLEKMQSLFQKENLSFLAAPVPSKWQKEHPDIKNINHTLTLREAIDMVMMEELEKELLGPDEDIN